MLETAPTPRPFLFLRSSEIGLLKATLKKLVMVPGYTRSDGRFVAAHQKAVHYNPDVLFADVAAGKGSHSQKKAHAKLSNKAWWQGLSVDDQAIAIMALATDIQDAASNSAAVSGWKASASAGKNPTKKEWAAFYALPKDKQAALHDHVQGAAGGLAHLQAPSLPVPPEKATAIEQDAAPAETPPAGHISFPGGNNTSYHVNAISGGKFSVSVKDDDSGETLPTMTIFPTLEGAIASAKALSEKSKAAGASSAAAPAAALDMPAFESVQEGVAWAKARASKLGMTWGEYRTTAEYKDHVYPVMAALHGGATDAYAKTQVEAGKKAQAAMAAAGVHVGDKVAWDQAGSYLSTQSFSGVVKLDKHGVPTVHLDGEMAIAGASGKISYVKKVAWQPHMKPANAAAPQAAPTPSDLGEFAGIDASLQAHSKLAAMESGPHYQKAAIAKLKGDAAWQKLGPAEKHAQAMALYQAMQSAASQSAAVSVAKKAMLAGKVPSKAQYAALMAAGLDVQAKVAAEVGTDKYHDLMMAAQAAVEGKPGNTAAAAPVPPVSLVEQAKRAMLAGNPPSKEQYIALVDAGSKVLDEVTDAVGAAQYLELMAQGHKNAGAEGTAAVKKLVAKKVAATDAPKEGDTKPGADGSLIFKDGRWHKVVAADEHGEVPPVYVPVDEPAAPPLTDAQVDGLLGWIAAGKPTSNHPLSWSGLWKKLTPEQKSYIKNKSAPAAPKIPLVVQPSGGVDFESEKLPASNSNAPSHNKAVLKIQALALAGDKAGLESFIANKADAKQTYAKKQVKLAQAVLASIANPVVPSAPMPPAGAADAVDKMSLAELKAIVDATGIPKASNDLIKQKIAQLEASNAPAAPEKVTVQASLYGNTTNGHNKQWSVSVHGKDVKVEWGKIGAKQQSLTKHFDSEVAAKAHATELKTSKLKGGYHFDGYTTHHHGESSGKPPIPVVVKPAAPESKNDGKTKQGVAGLLVLKDGHWVLANPDDGFKLATKGKTQKSIKEAVATFGVSSKVKEKAIKAAASGDITEFLAMLNVASDSPNLKKTTEVLKAIAKMAGLSFDGDGAAPSVAAPSMQQAWPIPKPSSAPTAGHKAVSVSGTKVQSMDDWKQTGDQAGSNPGGQFTDKAGGKWYVKFPKTDAHAKNELLAAKFYEMLGVAGPKLKLVAKDGKIGVASKWVEGTKQAAPETLKALDGALSNFAIDAWLANWDVVGTGYDNLKVGPDGKAIRIDAGGSLLYRAQGEPKGAAFGDEVAELGSLVDPGKNGYSAAVFSGITKDQMLPGLKQLAKLKPSQIETLVDKIGPGSGAEKAALAKKLIARRAHILAHYGIEDRWNKPPPNEAKLIVDKSKLPKPIDFNNIDGKPLSSKKHVNDQNSKDSAALVSFASRGNLKALKDYKYDAVDKETGKDLGKKPIADHPSAKIKHQWAELVTHLQAIAYPPSDTLPMPSFGLGGGSASEVADAVGFYSPADNVETISSENRMGFFMKLASVDSVEDAMAESKWRFLSASDPFINSAEAAYKGYSSLTKGYISGVQASGSINHVWSQGKSGHVHGLGVTKEKIAAQLYHDATELPDGTTLWRWMDDSAGTTMKGLLDAKPGDTFQNTDSMCSSYKDSWGNSKHFGSHIRLKIRCAKGSKAIISYGSGSYSSEGEFTTLPGARFLIVSTKKGIPGNANGVDVECIMLPPDEGYVAELGKLAQITKAATIASPWHKNLNSGAKSIRPSPRPLLIIRSGERMSLADWWPASVRAPKVSPPLSCPAS